MSRNFDVVDVKPTNSIVLDVKPKMDIFSRETERYTVVTRVLGAGMYLGIPSITYPQTGTVTDTAFT